MNAEPLKLTIMDVPGGRVIAQAKRKGSFEVWRAFMNHGELLEWLSNEIGYTAPSPGGDADAPDAGAVGSLPSRPDETDEQLAAHLRHQFAQRIKDAAPGDDERRVEAEPEPVAAHSEPVSNARRPKRTREEKIAALVDFVGRALEGRNGPVHLRLKEFRAALGMTDQAVLDTISHAVERGLLVKTSRTASAGRQESWYSLPGAPSAPPPANVPAPANAARVVQLVEHVRQLGGDRQMVRVSYAMLKQALGVSDPVVSQAINAAVEDGLLIKEKRRGAIGPENWMGLPGAQGEAPVPSEDLEQTGVQQEGGEATGKAEPDGSPAPSGMPAARMSPAELDAATARVSQVVAAREAKPAAQQQNDDLVPGQPQVLAALRGVAERIHSPSFEMQLNRLANKSGLSVERLPTILAALSKRGLIEWTNPKQMGGFHKFWVKGAKA